MIFVEFLVSMFALLLVGVPIAVAILGTVAIMIVTTGLSNFTLLPTYLFSGTNSFAMMAVPFFMLAGEIMNEGELSKGIVDFCRTLLGHVKAGLGYVAVLACMMFACVSGAAVATVSAIGGIMLPILIQEGYDREDSTAIICAGSITGPIIPPSIPMVLFGTISGVSVTRMFVSGVIPGIIAGVLVMITWKIMSKNKEYKVLPRASVKEVIESGIKALPCLFMPVIMMGGMLTGIFTPTEAGVVAVVYAFLVATFLNRKMNIHVLKKCMVNAAKSSAVVMFIVATTTALAAIITVAQIPQVIAAGLSAVSQNPLVIMCLINVIILIIGLFMDVIPAISIVGPIFLPIVKSLGVDPTIFGVTMIFGLVIGLLTPPVGAVLYIGCSMGEISLMQLVKKIAPLVGVYLLVLFLLTFFPGLITFLPDLVM
ncbi:TRAP transporter large permease [Lachnoclostridium edouardi]|uniref:TRAP transporter large permease n=1 Tax=Lachnoclostridium edouardi TaxID=1926283 RepID=UPI000C7B261F|nr:TRAP transporter large permease [Lachnoclostridium edouardi]